MIEYYEARVLFDYDPVTSDELCLRVGENVEVRVGDDDGEEGWLYGSDVRGRHGIFPANYVADLRSPAGAAHDSPDGNLGGGSSATYHGAGDAEHAGDGGASVPAHDLAHHPPRGQPYREGLVQAAHERRDDSAAARHYHPQDTAASAHHAGVQRDRGHGATGIATTGYHHDEDARTGASGASRASQQREPASTCHAHAPEEKGNAFDQLPDGWLCTADPDSGAMYYYTADGQGSWIRPTSTVVAAAAEPLPESGEGNPAASGNQNGLPGGGQDFGVSACLCEVLRSSTRVLGVRATWEKCTHGRGSCAATFFFCLPCRWVLDP